MRFLGTLPILAVLALSAAAQGPTKGEPPAKRELFAKEDWYKDEKGKEQPFVGVIKMEKGGGVGIGRFNPYRLNMTVTEFVLQTIEVDGKQVIRMVPVTRMVQK